jgi:succinate-semialdehyde dehydrogenase/glutarate-semialdehyde dehydrogenase
MFRTLNPATGELIEEYPFVSDKGLEEHLSQLDTSYHAWREISLSSRTDCLTKLRQLLLKDVERFASLIGLEMGKPIRFARAEIEKCALVCDYYAREAENFLKPVVQKSEIFSSATKYFRPQGTVLAIMPWNYPFYQVFRFAVPNLVAGNAVLLKHSPNTPGCALAIEELFDESFGELKPFSSMFLSHQQCEKVIKDPRIIGLNLTGSVKAGRAVASLAGQSIKKSVLELGGSDPFVVFADADVEKAARTAANARLSNTGQVCCAPKRLIIESSIRDEFVESYLRQAETKKIGKPTDENSDLGPMAREDLKQQLAAQVKRSTEAGASICTPNCPAPEEGFYTNPLLLIGGGVNNPAAREELFGPVAWVDTFEKENESVLKANDTEFGLAASVWSEDPKKASRVAGDIQAGVVVVNSSVTSDPSLPFGGVKNSGYGKELGEEGIKEFLNTQLVMEA